MDVGKVFVDEKVKVFFLLLMFQFEKKHFYFQKIDKLTTSSFGEISLEMFFFSIKLIF
jgi:hypothetical protein